MLSGKQEKKKKKDAVRPCNYKKVAARCAAPHTLLIIPKLKIQDFDASEASYVYKPLKEMELIAMPEDDHGMTQLIRITFTNHL